MLHDENDRVKSFHSKMLLSDILQVRLVLLHTLQWRLQEAFFSLSMHSFLHSAFSIQRLKATFNSDPVGVGGTACRLAGPSSSTWQGDARSLNCVTLR
jgi:hypothetical protein